MVKIMTSPRLDARLNAYSPMMLSVFRIVIGLMFTIHGSSKVLGIPFGEALPAGSWPGWWSGLIELVAGLLVTIGLATRPAAFVAAGEMAVAYFWGHVIDLPPDMTPSFWPHVNMGELAVVYCFAFLLILFLGPGSLAVDSRRRRPMTGQAVTGTAAPVARPGLLDRFRRGGAGRRY